MVELMERLAQAPGVSGDEGSVRSIIEQELEGICTLETDALGNLIAFKKGKEASSQKLMLAAHMDEVGFLVTYVEDSGMLRFTAVGGIDERVVIGRPVLVGRNRVAGVIGTKAVHMQTAAEKEKVCKLDELYIDIGAASKAEAQRMVSLGDSVVFASDFVRFGDGFVKSKALDDRAGCAVLVALAKRELRYDTYFVFTVQEEIGSRGAKTAAFAIDPDAAIVVDVTTAADVGGVSKDKQVCLAGKGPVLSFMDRATSYDRRSYQAVQCLAKEKGIPCQVKMGVYGGNDAGSIHVSRSGVRTLAVSLPGRYIHSAACVLKLSDAEDTVRLLQAAIEQMDAVFDASFQC
ncbi:M42 family metallopeptidase [Candidatus Soleaferrea massiliensis]|uniref:M42 family metallopeptidase n=1 Tax=Candidatus Soleaferrea massiliensis TaxID=1470354 RepID=UPI00058BB3C6|nr:M42 family metallopeptidase [Candidatus Soleaferrea massiliensis]